MGTMTRTGGIVLAAVLAVAACGGDESGDDESAAATSPSTTAPPESTVAATTAPPATGAAPSTTAAPATTASSATTAVPTTTMAPATTAPPATTVAPGPDLPDTPVTAVIDQAYAFDGSAPDPDLLPARPGDVTARWYRAGGVLAVVYDGLAVDAPACPGNSAQTTAGFDFVSNAPLPGTSCDGFPTLIESNATQGVQICGDTVSYLTLIPTDFAAVLYASIERPVDGVGGVGLTGFVLVEDPSTVPEIIPALLSC